VQLFAYERHPGRANHVRTRRSGAHGHSRHRARAVRRQQAAGARARARQVDARVQDGDRGRDERSGRRREEAGFDEVMTVLGPLGPMWVAKVLILIGLAGVLAAVIARAKGHAFLPWLMYG